MASIAKSTLFPADLVNQMFSKVTGHSSIAKLSAQKPLSFAGNEVMVFSLDNEVSIVGEGAAKPAGDGVVSAVTIVPVKVVYQARVNDEFIYAADEKRVEYLEAFADGFSKKIARGLDIMAFHGINPAAGTTSSLIGTNSFDTCTAVDSYVSTAAETDITAAIAGIDGDVNGIALSKSFAVSLAATTLAGGQRPYEEFMWGGNPGAIRGIACDVNDTVSVSASTATADCAIIGDFQNAFRWGFSKNVPLEVIEYGNPDGGTYDLKQANQVLLRAEAYVGWGILNPDAFARVKTK